MLGRLLNEINIVIQFQMFLQITHGNYRSVLFFENYHEQKIELLERKIYQCFKINILTSAERWKGQILITIFSNRRLFHDFETIEGCRFSNKEQEKHKNIFNVT